MVSHAIMSPRGTEFVMNDLLLLLAGVAAGTYFAEQIRSTVPLLDPTRSTSTLDGSTTTGGA